MTSPLMVKSLLTSTKSGKNYEINLTIMEMDRSLLMRYVAAVEIAPSQSVVNSVSLFCIVTLLQFRKGFKKMVLGLGCTVSSNSSNGTTIEGYLLQVSLYQNLVFTLSLFILVSMLVFFSWRSTLMIKCKSFVKKHSHGTLTLLCCEYLSVCCVLARK